RVELVADEPVLERPEVAKRDSLALDRVPEDVADPRRVRAERWHDTRRQRLREQVESLEDTGPREVEVDIALEDHVDHREAERGRRPHDAYPGQALQTHGQRIRDLVFALLRRASGPVGEDDD